MYFSIFAFSLGNWLSMPHSIGKHSQVDAGVHIPVNKSLSLHHIAYLKLPMKLAELHKLSALKKKCGSKNKISKICFITSPRYTLYLYDPFPNWHSAIPTHFWLWLFKSRFVTLFHTNEGEASDPKLFYAQHYQHNIKVLFNINVRTAFSTLIEPQVLLWPSDSVAYLPASEVSYYC